MHAQAESHSDDVFKFASSCHWTCMNFKLEKTVKNVRRFDLTVLFFTFAIKYVI